MIDKKRKKEEKKMVSANRSHQELPLDLFLQILIRLPIKHLLKCLYVSKSWCSIIHRPEFIQAYCNRNPFSLLLSIPNSPYNEYKFLRHRRLYCSNIASYSGQQQEFFTPFDPKMGITNYPVFYGVTQMINGLFCTYLGNLAFLVNAFTGQVTQLIPRPDIRPKAFSSTCYYFGFEPTTGLYKLLCVREITFNTANIPDINGGTEIREFHILTININCSDSPRESSWKLVQLPAKDARLYNLYGGSISVNGTLYWIQKGFHEYNYNVISCFNLTTEKFTRFAVNLEDHPRQPRLVQFRGKLSIVYCVDGVMVICTLEMDLSWTVHKANLPEELQQGAIPIPTGNLWTNQTVLANCRTNGAMATVYAYNHGSNRFERFVVKFPQTLDFGNKGEVGIVVSCVEQNMEMVEALIRQFNPEYKLLD